MTGPRKTSAPILARMKEPGSDPAPVLHVLDLMRAAIEEAASDRRPVTAVIDETRRGVEWRHVGHWWFGGTGLVNDDTQFSGIHLGVDTDFGYGRTRCVIRLEEGEVTSALAPRSTSPVTRTRNALRVVAFARHAVVSAAANADDEAEWMRQRTTELLGVLSDEHAELDMVVTSPTPFSRTKLTTIHKGPAETPILADRCIVHLRMPPDGASSKPRNVSIRPWSAFHALSEIDPVDRLRILSPARTP